METLNGMGTLQAAFLVLVTSFIYFIPSLIGTKKENFTAILLLNIFLGWTFVGWVIALVWSVTKDKK